MKSAPNQTVDNQKLSEALEAVPAIVAPDCDDSYLIQIGRAQAEKIGACLQELSRRFLEAKYKPAEPQEFCFVLLGSQGRLAVVSALRASDENPQVPAGFEDLL